MWMFYSAVQAALDLVRECPKCKNKQKIQLCKRHKPVRCSQCGGTINPAKYKM